ncbi:MarR family winged helix-turn-helix transcriptional regulator [Actinomadura keratinilytica]|uniref:HTH marR-type domain-containing protein n=1 Tax=Actinomadura keratinilytica TaxID=547461 RepID=A0ABP7ZG67_9ACTN
MADPGPAKRPDRAPSAATPPAASPYDPLLRGPAYLVAELMKLIRREAAGTLPGAERMRPPAVLVLACVAAEGGLSQRQVSERLRMDPADVVSLVDILEESGYLERRRDPADRRRYRLDATEDGRLFLSRRREASRRLNQRLFAPLSPQELEQFTDMIVRVLARHDSRFAEFGPPCAGADDTPA